MGGAAFTTPAPPVQEGNRTSQSGEAGSRAEHPGLC